jgi:hypothetical protein
VGHNWQHEMDDEWSEARDRRIAALEEIIAARWPRSMIMRHRLARSLRTIGTLYAWAEDNSFAIRQNTAMAHPEGAPTYATQSTRTPLCWLSRRRTSRRSSRQ